MDSTGTARRPLGNDAANRPYAEPTGGYAGRTPIYTALVAEWRARGRTVPEHHGARRASFAAPTASGRGPVPAVPFRVPVPLLPPPGAEAPEDLTGPPDPRAPR